jgi:hypothetical protein
MNSLTKEQWIERCAKRLQEVAHLDAGMAHYIAESQLENLRGDLTENPEDAADDEISYWTPD